MPRDPDKLKPVPGARIRLLRDVTTRSGRKFRTGLRMVLCSTEGCYFLKVKVRARWFYLQLRKKDYPFYFEIVEPPPRIRDEDDDGNRAAEAPPGGDGSEGPHSVRG